MNIRALLARLRRIRMPVSYPYKIINAAGTYRMDPHTQAVFVSTAQLAAAVNIYLPPARLIATPITVVVKGAGNNHHIRLYPQVGKTVGGGDYYQFPRVGPSIVTVFYGDQCSVQLLPEVNTAGQVSGNWNIVGGEMVQFVATSQSGTQSVAANANTKITPLIDNVSAEDPTGSVIDGTAATITLPEYGWWIINANVSVAGLAANDRVALGVGAGSFIQFQHFIANGIATERFNACWKYNAGPFASQFQIRHSSGGNRTVSNFSFQASRLV